MRKVPFRISAPAFSEAGDGKLELRLLGRSSGSRALDTADVTLRVRLPTTRKIAFLGIDGSVQYYALQPRRPPGETAPGAVPDAARRLGRGDRSGRRVLEQGWGDLVAPTNRRPYGFDWEDWGRLTPWRCWTRRGGDWTDPRRRLPDRPLDGRTRRVAGRRPLPGPVRGDRANAGLDQFQLLRRGRSASDNQTLKRSWGGPLFPSDTLAYSRTTTPGVYILHGGADDNVPVGQAREMRRSLAAFHHDFDFFEQPGAGHWWDVSPEPGADCVDWPPMFDFFARHASRRTRTCARSILYRQPGISAWSHWAGIVAQIHPLQTSSLHLRWDPGLRRLTGTTENVARLALLRLEGTGSPDDRAGRPPPARRTLAKGGRYGAHLSAGAALVRAEPPAFTPAQRSAAVRAVQGSFPKPGPPRLRNTRHRGRERVGVRKVRFDAESFWPRFGNGAITMVPDTPFHPDRSRTGT